MAKKITSKLQCSCYRIQTGWRKNAIIAATAMTTSCPIRSGFGRPREQMPTSRDSENFRALYFCVSLLEPMKPGRRCESTPWAPPLARSNAMEKPQISETSAFDDELTLLAQTRNRGGWLSETNPRAEPTTIRRIWPMMRLSLCWHGQPPLATHGDQAASSASSPINVSLDGENSEHLPLALRLFIEVWIKLFGLQKSRRVCNSIGVH